MYWFVIDIDLSYSRKKRKKDCYLISWENFWRFCVFNEILISCVLMFARRLANTRFARSASDESF